MKTRLDFSTNAISIYNLSNFISRVGQIFHFNKMISTSYTWMTESGVCLIHEKFRLAQYILDIVSAAVLNFSAR